MSARKHEGTFATISREILSHPPIAMRKNPARWSLKPLEFVVLCGLTNAARIQRTRQGHDEALKSGRAQIEEEKELDAEFRKDWRRVQHRRQKGGDAKAPRRLHTFDGEFTHRPRVRLKTALKKAGRAGYERARNAQRREGPPKVVSFALTRTAILRFSGLSQDGKNFTILDSILYRLCRPIAVNGFYLPPPINEFYKMGDGQISISLEGEYLPARIFARIPLPLPVRSPIGLALFLFLQNVKTGQLQSGCISMISLCGRLGIPTDISNWRTLEQIHRALDAVNAHLAKLDIPKLRKAGVKLPAKYETREAEDGKVSFVAIPYRAQHDFEDLDGPRNLTKRTRANEISGDLGGEFLNENEINPERHAEYKKKGLAAEEPTQKRSQKLDWREKQSKAHLIPGFGQMRGNS
jgi:hypothetical protein